MLNTREFSRMYAKAYGVTKEYAFTICSTVFDMLASELYDEEENIYIQGLGTFRQALVSSRRVRHPGTGQMMIIPPKKVVKFKPSECFVKQLDDDVEEEKVNEEQSE